MSEGVLFLNAAPDAASAGYYLAGAREHPLWIVSSAPRLFAKLWREIGTLL